ncbi:MAG: hypothetical protein CME19_02100 [Gemmatimonadetes bacterium]|nr:hypothetical protein [Gemmatimonadota bacterium]|tara:strand:+ start:393 stop:1178 length:786 start_codon:yes stop_codon:yes gene_type:complete
MFGSITYLLFSHLAVGGILTISLVPDQASRGFFRFCASACALLLVVALSVGDRPSSVVSACLLVTVVLLIAFVLLVVTDRLRMGRPLLVLAAASGLVGLGAHGLVVVPKGWPAWVAYASAAYEVSSAAFLGSVIFAMTLGHWYLVVPTLPIGALRALTQLMIYSTAAKTLLLGVVLYLGAGSTVPEIADTVSGFSDLPGLFFWARTLFGLVGPIIVCYMTWETVKLNATQSATGLLYVSTILVLIGETLSRFLYHTTNLPV